MTYVPSQTGDGPRTSEPDLYATSLTYALRYAVGVLSSRDPDKVPPPLTHLLRRVEEIRPPAENEFSVRVVVVAEDGGEDRE